MRRCGGAFTLGLCVALAASCTPRRHQPPATPAVRSGPATVAVLPFRMGGEIDHTTTFAERADQPPVPDVGARMATQLSADLARSGISTVDPAVVQEATPAPGAARYDTELAARVAGKVGAQFGVFGALTRFVEREGSAWGASTPATVWYQAVLVDAASGAVVTRERFEYTQQPLSQNLLDLPRFLQGGGRWVTRDEMLDGALVDTAGRLARAIRNPPAPAPR
jgi:hypothetical protein